MIDLKFHVYSIVGIFLALTIGMIIGNAMNKDYSLTKENNKTMNRYADTIKNLKLELEKNSLDKEYQKQILGMDEDFITQISSQLIKNKLKNRNISIFVVGKNDQIVADIKDLIEIAGGETTSITTVTKPGLFFNENTKEIDDIIIESGHGIIKNVTLKRSKFYGIISRVISGDLESSVEVFKKSTLFSLVGDYNKKPDTILILGDLSTAKGLSDTQSVNMMTNSLKNIGLPVIGGETTGRINSHSVWASEDIPNVDNIETSLGKISIIYALADKSGRYGTKKTSNKKYPVILGDDF